MTRTNTRTRKAIADEIIAAGGNMTTFAKAIGVSPAGALFWLRRHAPDQLASLVSGRRRNELAPHDVLVRLLWLKAVEGRRGHLQRVCRVLGISPQRLHDTRKTWAPDGLDAAIADLMPDDDHPSWNGKRECNQRLNGLFPAKVHEVAHG